MDNLLILYNPYYEKRVIEKHVEILNRSPDPLRARVAFGKVRSKLRDHDHPYTEYLQAIYARTNEEHPLQLFLTDYSDMYVARVVEATDEDRSDLAPSYYYYKEKNLDVETWYVLDDIRGIAHDDFRFVRDRVLSNFTTPNFEGRHYAIYGNRYVYPLVVEMDEPVDYFDYDFEDRHYFQEIFLSEQNQSVQRQLIHFRFGEELFFVMHPNSRDAVVAAELEYLEKKDDPLYDFSSVVIKYSKAFEREFYLFGKKFFGWLGERSDLSDIEYEVQGRSYSFDDYQNHKPNIGTTKYMLGNRRIRQAIDEHVVNPALKSFIRYSLRFALGEIQEIRNEAAHGRNTGPEVCARYREKIVGIGSNGLLCDLVRHKRMIG